MSASTDRQKYNHLNFEEKYDFKNEAKTIAGQEGGPLGQKPTGAVLKDAMGYQLN